MSRTPSIIGILMVTSFMICCSSFGVWGKSFELMEARIIGIFAITTNESCVDSVPFANPDNRHTFYQCFFINGTQWFLVELECDAGGIYDAESQACVEDVSTTEPATTEPPTTEPATTEPATTEPATTKPPTTEPATTEPPTTEPATTEPPTTEPPTTEPATTEPPTTEPPTTESPTTEPATTEPPTTEPPTTEPPTTEPATTEPPTTEPPTTEPATTEPPTTEPATTEPPTTEPATTEPLTTEPATTEPATTEPATTEPATTEPPTTEPATTEPPTTEPPTTKPATTEPPTTEPATTEPPTPTTEPAITTTRAPEIVCTANSTYPLPNDPTSYYKCIQIEGQWYHYIYTCPPSSCFNPTTRLCQIGICPTTTTTPPTTTVPTTVTAAPTTPPPVATPAPNTCTAPGIFPNTVKCTMYYRCISIGGTLVKYEYTCPANSFFNPTTNLCTVGPCPSTPPPNTTTPTTTTPPPTTTAVAVSTTTLTPVSPPPTAPTFRCSSEGYFADSSDCSTYYYCLPDGPNWYVFVYHCSAGSYFSSAPPVGCLIGICPSTNATTSPIDTTTVATTAATTAATTVDTTTVPTTTAVTTTSAPPVFTCTAEGRFPPSPTVCSQAYNLCRSDGLGGYSLYLMVCPTGSYFDPPSQLCYVGTCPTY